MFKNRKKQLFSLDSSRISEKSLKIKWIRDKEAVVLFLFHMQKSLTNTTLFVEDVSAMQVQNHKMNMDTFSTPRSL